MNYQVPNWFLRWQRQRNPPRPSTKEQISIHSARAYFYLRKKKRLIEITYRSRDFVSEEKPSWEHPCRFFLFRSNIGYLFHRAWHVPVIVIAIRVTRLQFLSANLQSHANPRKIIFHLTARSPAPSAATKARLSSYFFRLTLFRRPDAKLWISGDCSGEDSARF